MIFSFSVFVIIVIVIIIIIIIIIITPRPHGLPFSWWGCYGLCLTNQPSSPTPFYSVLVPIYVFMALSTVFHSINSPDKSPLSRSVLPVLFLPH